MIIKPASKIEKEYNTAIGDMVVVGVSLAVFIPGLRSKYPDLENHVDEVEHDIKDHINDMIDIVPRTRAAMVDVITTLFVKARDTNPVTRQEWRNALTAAFKELMYYGEQAINKQFPELFDVAVVTTVIQ